MPVELTQYASIEHCNTHIHVEFNTPHQVVSSAVCHGGLVLADHIVNMKVAKNTSTIESPDLTILKYAKGNGWNGTVVGLMTAASMRSFRMVKKSAQGVDIFALVTSGLSNPRRAGDYAEYRYMNTGLEEVGTINIIVVTSAKLSEAAMIEALLITTEAKAAALQDAGIISPVSNQVATGTGTDSVAVVSGQGPEQVHYCGKHVLFGELLGKAVIEAVSSSIQWRKP
ncbi:adenosylcobinamide amidohydrolase [Teredinibacter sp. KSP-S5-2]|uniref:adenosylcobinamide amidohydrolase n=1 Tax=Teredinibacter sp. KSP-S5-2 TaxID=3034506 RepID=UPI0029343A17|nr:adenosylcobinamide amidohydrolase [Teredinibacter sp. KSP-S5-2]WNO07972.1 adenosylcobinamide amidohydrolase [Teredinibacter sp. KSP-S5-2]